LQLATSFFMVPESVGRRLKLLALACAALLIGALGGCSTYSAYRKCGFGGCPGDAAISAEVRGLFKQHPALEPPNLLYVQTVDHVVYLSGVLNTDLERQTAESVALEAPGVARIVDSIGVSNER